MQRKRPKAQISENALKDQKKTSISALDREYQELYKRVKELKECR